MFDWLVDELSKIKTPKFHRIDGPASPELRSAVLSSAFPLPPAYKEFVLQFGNAKLFRRDSYYYVCVFASPREAESSSQEAYLQFGQTWISKAYFKESLLSPGKDSAVFEWFTDGIRKTADGFEEWLKQKCDGARKRYSKREWQDILRGPRPFTELEQRIVEARKHFHWKVIGIAPNDDLRFEMRNDSDMILPYLSVGIRGKLRPPKTGELNGGAFLPVRSVRPGETKVIDFDCYKQFVLPNDTEVIELPDPGPEDRENYWEFKAVQ